MSETKPASPPHLASPNRNENEDEPQPIQSFCTDCRRALLAVCLRFGDGTGYRTLVIPHQPFDRMRARAAAGCLICTRLLSDAETARAQLPVEQQHDWSEYAVQWKVDAPDPALVPQFAFPHDSALVSVALEPTRAGGVLPRGLGMGFRVYPAGGTQEHPHLTDVRDAVSSQGTWSPESVGRASRWILDCARHHPRCRRSLGAGRPGWRPERLLFIDGDGGRVRLVGREDLPDPCGYLTLSHCWGAGGGARVLLTSANIEEWTERLPLEQLAPTFFHALRVAATLGVPYLWIDSLCILQDSREDWLAQSAVMGDIYKNAEINLAAVSARSDDDGFLYPRDPRVNFGFTVDLAAALESPRTVNEDGQDCVLLEGVSRFVWNASAHADQAWHAPLYTRAWVFQESCLARRTLGFGRGQLMWQCDEGSASEVPDASASFERAGIRKLLNDYEGAASLADFDRQAFLDTDFASSWHGLVTSYTLCALTRASDKLMAISAVARDLATIVRRRYLAGLWDVDVVRQLGWHTVHGRTTPPAATFLAPSWSWASIDAPVQPGMMGRAAAVPLLDVLAADVDLVTDYEFGSVRGGRMRVRGGLRAVRALTPGTARHGAALVDDGEVMGFCPDTTDGLARRDAAGLYYVPLLLNCFEHMIECKALVLCAVAEPSPPPGGGGGGGVVFRRLGTADYGRIPSLWHRDRLLQKLGSFPMQADGTFDNLGPESHRGFRRSDEGFVELTIV